MYIKSSIDVEAIEDAVKGAVEAVSGAMADVEAAEGVVSGTAAGVEDSEGRCCPPIAGFFGAGVGVAGNCSEDIGFGLIGRPTSAALPAFTGCLRAGLFKISCKSTPSPAESAGSADTSENSCF